MKTCALLLVAIVALSTLAKGAENLDYNLSLGFFSQLNSDANRLSIDSDSKYKNAIHDEREELILLRKNLIAFLQTSETQKFQDNLNAPEFRKMELNPLLQQMLVEISTVVFLFDLGQDSCRTAAAAMNILKNSKAPFGGLGFEPDKNYLALLNLGGYHSRIHDFVRSKCNITDYESFFRTYLRELLSRDSSYLKYHWDDGVKNKRDWAVNSISCQYERHQFVDGLEVKRLVWEDIPWYASDEVWDKDRHQYSGIYKNGVEVTTLEQVLNEYFSRWKTIIR